MADALIFAVCIVDQLVLITMTVYFIICLSDLECDYVNSRLGCKKLNQWVLPELVCAWITPVLLFVSFHWFLFLLTLPIAVYLLHRFLKKPKGNVGLYDPTEIRNRGLLLSFEKEAFIKIAVHLIIFFTLLYCFIIALVM